MIEKLKSKIFIATAFTLGIYSVLFLWLLSPSWWVELLSDLPTWLETIKWVLPFVFSGIAYFLVNLLDIHNWLDKTFFKERRKVDEYIRNQITSPCKETTCTRSKKGILKNEERKLMSLFYTFIPEGDTERERAFAYWGEYFITVNLSFISILAFFAAVVAVALDFSRAIHIAPYLILVFLILFNLVRVKLKKRLLYPAEAQTARILSSNSSELKERLPKYRIQCRACPLNPLATAHQ